MPSTTELGILIKTLYDNKGMKAAKKDIEGIDDAGRQAGKGGLDKVRGGLGNIAIAAGAVGAGLFAAKKLFDFGAEGAQLTKVSDTFDKLTASIGETSGVIIGDLRDATAGMVADAELMASANQLMSMGLANTGTEVANLQELAVGLGSAMGKNATQSMEEFSLLLANQSIPRLDTFGISASTVRTRIKELMEADKDLTRETAFMTATMEEAEKSFERLGGEIPTDGFTQMTVATANLGDELKMLVGQALGPAASGMAGFLAENRTGAEQTAAFKKAIELNIISQKEYDDALTRSREGVISLAEVNEELQSRIDGVTSSIDESDRIMLGYADNTEDIGKQWELNANIAANIKNATIELTAAQQAGLRTTYEAQTAGQQLTETYRLQGEEVLLLRSRNADMFGALTSAIGLSADTLGDWTDENIRAAIENFVLQEKIAELKAEVEAGDLTWGDALETLRAYRTELGFMGDAIANLPDHKRIEFEMVITGQVPDLMSGGGTTTASGQGGVPPPSGNTTNPGGNQGGQPEPGFAQGGVFTVPAGYPNDSYRIGLTSGERVSVTPAGQNSGSGNVIIYVQGGDSQQVMAAVNRALDMAGIKSNNKRRTI